MLIYLCKIPSSTKVLNAISIYLNMVIASYSGNVFYLTYLASKSPPLQYSYTK